MAATSKTATLSRLDKVFALLENGDSAITRKAAAKQIGEVQKKYPHELNNLLAKLLSYVTSPEWSTRIAAAEAIEVVVDQVPKWMPAPSVKKENDQFPLPESEKLSFSHFDVDKVLSSSKLLLGSSGDEYQLPQNFAGATVKDRVRQQRLMLEKRLGLCVGANTSLGVSSDDLFQDEDLVEASIGPSIKQEEETKKQVCEVMMSQLSGEMSSRERNRAKRKARLLMKQQSKERRNLQDNASKDCQSSKKRKTDKDDKGENRTFISLDNVPLHHADPQDWTDWPFDWFCDELMNTLFSNAWESRHGACLALREILKKHGGGCGQVRGMDTVELRQYHQSWLCDLSVRLLCVVTLDRFADYVSDQVTAPVRESCAQTLSVVASHLEEKHVFDTINILLHLFGKSEWEIRQSAMLSLQYVVAVRQDLQRKLLPVCFPAFARALQDADGDVMSVSAKCLLPTTGLLIEQRNADKLQMLLSILWESLRDYDELTASTQSIMLLLSKILTSLPPERVCQAGEPQLLLGRLWPFLQHTSVSVRKASLSTVKALIGDDSDEVLPWLAVAVHDAAWHVFQCTLLESCPEVRLLAEEVFVRVARKSPPVSLTSCARHLPLWFLLSCQPLSAPIEPSMLIRNETKQSFTDGVSSDQQRFIGGSPSSYGAAANDGLNYEEHVAHTREVVTRFIGILCCHTLRNAPSQLPNEQAMFQDIVKEHLKLYLTSPSALQRMVASTVVWGWWREARECGTVFPVGLSPEVRTSLCDVQNSGIYFSEMTVKFIQVQTDMKALLPAINQQCGINLPLQTSYAFHEVVDFCVDQFPSLVPSSNKELWNQRCLLLSLAQESLNVHSTLDCRVKTYASRALLTAALNAPDHDELQVWKLPDKLNPTIRPLMECIKVDENVTVRGTASSAVADLLGLCAERVPCPNPKLIRNLCAALTSSTARCPTVDSVSCEFSAEVLSTCKLTADQVRHDGIITLLRQQAAIANEILSKKKKTRQGDDQPVVTSHAVERSAASDGAEQCLRTICTQYQERLLDILPHLWARVTSFNDVRVDDSSDEDVSAKVVDILMSLCTLEVMIPVITDRSLRMKVLSLLPSILALLWNDLSNVRYVSARCLASLARHLPEHVMPVVVEEVAPKLDNIHQPLERRGSIEAVAGIVDKMGAEVVPYAVLLVVPLLGRMSDQDVQIRLLATHCFAQLIQYIPVESSIPDPPDMPPQLMEKKRRERRFLEQLFDTSSLEPYHVPVTINASLRSYQQDGVKWLAFLNRYKLHGILCDDMGLGKTLQTICIIASDHYYKEKKHKTEQDARQRLVSLVVCPPTLTGHWVSEVNRFCDHLNPLQYAGVPQERARLQEQAHAHNLIVASYEVVRNDINFFNKLKWNYCVLDEGHAIRSGKSKITQCVKSLVSNHRLILTGTPIQNSVLELWSLFDFLMPGFLGSEQAFNVRFTKPILASRDARTSSKEQELGLLALQTLHRQVLPFMLRRMKEDVLKDLPPKIIQDYYCDLSPLQLQLYEDFAKSRAKKDAESSISKLDDDNDQRTIMKDASHVFQALQYLQKVCNHPLFVLTSSHPHYTRFMTQLKSSSTSLHDIKHAAKLPALKQLLLDCGIGVPPDANADVSVVGQHRALIFCQHRNMLDIIQNDLFAALMPAVSYLRLDGGIAAGQRFSIVSRFNDDPSIDVLLLTTKVGGLGLNLTGADTVIFVEHDWNPMVDLQAMDRAHRIGQKKVVNVYRLITRGTLEEKILGLQKFKLNVANTVVSEDNRGLQSMGTGQVLELFDVDKSSTSARKATGDDSARSKGLRAMVENLGDLWDQNQYDEEYNIDNFIRSLTDK